jgi:hypothetical protein
MTLGNRRLSPQNELLVELQESIKRKDAAIRLMLEALDAIHTEPAKRCKACVLRDNAIAAGREALK